MGGKPAMPVALTCAAYCERAGAVADPRKVELDVHAPIRAPFRLCGVRGGSLSLVEAEVGRLAERLVESNLVEVGGSSREARRLTTIARSDA